jgi:MFS family permease
MNLSQTHHEFSYALPMLNQLKQLRGYKGFTPLAASRFISNVGNGMSPIALAYGVLSIEGADGGDLSIVMAARFFPMIAFMLFGGVFADRFQRNRIVGGSDVIGSFLAATSAISLIVGSSSILLLSAMGALFGVLNALWWPAMSGVLPEILPKEKLQEGNAVIGLMSNIGNISGTLLGGIIVAALNPGWALLIDAATFFVAGIIVWNLNLASKAKIESPGIIHDLAVGWREFISRSWVVTMVITFALINMVFESMLQVLGPLNYSDPTTGPRLWSLNLAGLTAGMMIGGIIVLKIKFKRPLFISMILISISAIWDFTLALDLPTVICVLAGIFSGITLEFFMVTWNTSMQTHIPEESYSRVNAYDALGSFGIAPLGIVIAGPLAGHFGVNTILFVTGSITFIAAVASLFVKSVRDLSNS